MELSDASGTERCSDVNVWNGSRPSTSNEGGKRQSGSSLGGRVTRLVGSMTGEATEQEQEQDFG